MIFNKVFRITGSLWLSGIASILIGCTGYITSSDHVQAVSNVKKIGDVPNGDNSWFKMQFISEQEGWLGCGKKIWRTIDGGRNWKAIYSGSDFGDLLDHIQKLEFISPKTGWILVSSGKLFKTEDGGYTWKQQENVPLCFPNGELKDILFLKGGKIGWIAGGLYIPGYIKNVGKSSHSAANYHTAIFRTDNGGKTWVQEFNSANGGRIDDLFILDQSEVWASGEAGFFYRDTGNGRWEKTDYSKGSCARQILLYTTQTGQEGGDIFKPVTMYFLSTDQGWLSFKNGYMAKTTDGGRTWCDLLDPRTVWPSPSYDTFFSKVYFANLNHGWGLAAEGHIYETNDGGATWHIVNIEAKIEDIYFLKAGLGWAVAREGLFQISP